MNRLSSLASEVAAELTSREQTVAVAESSAGGLICAALLSIAGASAYFLGGGVIYTREARRILLDIPDADVAHLLPLSQDYVTRCAVAMRDKLGATWSVAEIGTTGPSGSRYGIPAGVCWLVVDGPVRRVRLIENAGDDREANMWGYTRAALDLLLDAIRAQA